MSLSAFPQFVNKHQQTCLEINIVCSSRNSLGFDRYMNLSASLPLLTWAIGRALTVSQHYMTGHSAFVTHAVS